MRGLSHPPEPLRSTLSRPVHQQPTRRVCGNSEGASNATAGADANNADAAWGPFSPS